MRAMILASTVLLASAPALAAATVGGKPACASEEQLDRLLRLGLPSLTLPEGCFMTETGERISEYTTEHSYCRIRLPGRDMNAEFWTTCDNVQP